MKTAIAAALMVPALSVPQPAAGNGPAGGPLHDRIDRAASEVMSKVIGWRRDLHRHPELGNREVRTAGIVAEHLRQLGLEVRTGIARTGVVGVLRGGKPGKVVALRADMDALPVTEETGLPFASTERAEYDGREVGVMHACGHDAHTSMLMGAAEVLAGLRDELPGTVVFIFQPAEEGAPSGEDGGAAVMIAEGVLDDPKVDAIFGLHVFPFEAGAIQVRPGGFMAGGDTLDIRVKGRQTHGALPWQGVDPIVVASQVVLGLQTIISRQSDLTSAPAVITLGIFQAGNRSNIIPDEARLVGTIRTFDQEMRREIHERVKRTASGIAEAAGTTAEVTIMPGNPITYNDPTLTAQIAPSLARVTTSFLPSPPVTTTSEDFSEYQQRVHGVFFFLGVAPKGLEPAKVEPNHSPRFMVEE
ncbi:MAG TPA: amidohydrolase, partial [Vicinamibacterales bacterium]|nr:amidohydrolase [Vicinamibacterales bacterium]